MKLFNKYQFHLFSMGIIAFIIGLLFHKVLTGEYIFGGPDSMSPSAINQGITSSEQDFGTYPLWLPWVFSGLPSVHSFQNISDYYFPNIFLHLLNSMGIPGFWNYILHFILAGMGVFSILRKLGVSKYSALFGGLSFSLMPYLITMVVHGHGSQMMTSAWLPWVIWGILHLHDETNLKNLGILGLLVGFQLQRGHVQIAYYTWMAAGVLIIMLLWNIHSSKSKWIIFVCGGLFLGLCMAMWIYIPALNYAPYSIRGAGGGGGQGFEYATNWSFSMSEMATFFIPSYYGFGGLTYWGSMGVVSNNIFHPFTDYPNYMGIIVLTMAVIGILYYENKIKWYFIIIGFLALLISFGKHLFLYRIFYDYFPYFNKFRVPAMILILTQFSMAALAGMGLDISSKWITNNTRKELLKKLTWVLGGILIIIIVLKFIIVGKQDFGIRSHPALNSLRIEMINSDMVKSILFLLIGGAAFYISRIGWIGSQTLVGIIIIASIIDLGIVDKQIIDPDKKSYRQSTMIKRSLKSSYLREDEVIKFLQQDTSKYRILPLGNLGNENRWSAFQIESIMGYHPAKIFRYNKLKDVVGWNSLGVLQMLNVKYILTLEELSHPAFERVFSGKLFHQGNYQIANVYQFKYVLPRAFIVQNIEMVPELNDQLDIIRKPGFDPQKTALLEEQIGEIAYHPDADVEIRYWSPNKIEIHADIPKDQLLVLSEIYYPDGWKITSHPDWNIYQVNSILRGIKVPVGKHHIVMEFIPEDILQGTIMTWGSTFILIIFMLSELIIIPKEDENRTKTI